MSNMETNEKGLRAQQKLGPFSRRIARFCCVARSGRPLRLKKLRNTLALQAFERIRRMKNIAPAGQKATSALRFRIVRRTQNPRIRIARVLVRTEGYS